MITKIRVIATMVITWYIVMILVGWNLVEHGGFLHRLGFWGSTAFYLFFGVPGVIGIGLWFEEAENERLDAYLKREAMHLEEKEKNRKYFEGWTVTASDNPENMDSKEKPVLPDTIKTK